MGPAGELHPYLSKQSEGNAVIDAVTAARGIPAANAGSRWISIGHSQGGHGAIFAGERAAEYAPELDLLGTVSLAPATRTMAPFFSSLTQVQALLASRQVMTTIVENFMGAQSAG